MYIPIHTIFVLLISCVSAFFPYLNYYKYRKYLVPGTWCLVPGTWYQNMLTACCQDAAVSKVASQRAVCQQVVGLPACKYGYRALGISFRAQALSHRFVP